MQPRRFLFLLSVLLFASFSSVFIARSVAQQETTTRYLYDEKSRLVGVVSQTGDVAVYEYDPAGNIVRIRRGSASRPEILSFFPREGVVGDRVTIIGTGFGESPEDNRVLFADNVAAEIVSASVTQLVVTVAPGTKTGAIKITSSTAQLTTAEPFTLVPPIRVQPSPVVVDFGQRVQFRADVRVQSSDRRVKWTVNGSEFGGNHGFVSQGGIYQAPQALQVKPPEPVTVAATSAAFPSLSAEVKFIVGRVTLTPREAVVEPGTTQAFQAELAAIGLPAADRTLVYTVNGVAGGNSRVGTVSSSGEYKAPVEIPSEEITVRAAGAAVPELFAEARVRLGRLTITPAQPTVAPGGRLQFTANLPGALTGRIRWSINGVEGGNTGFGTISPSGLYQAPANFVLEPLAVQAVAVEFPSLSGEAQIRMGRVRVTGSPSAFVDLGSGGSSSLAAEVEVGPGVNRQVVWTLNGQTEGDDFIGRLLATPGLPFAFYQPPARLPDVRVIARAALRDIPTIFGEIELVLGDMFITPATVTLGGGQSQKFTADAKLLSGDKRVIWSVQNVVGGNAAFGFINGDGVYFAPQNPPLSPIPVTATSASVRDLSRTVQVNVVSQVQVNPSSASAALGQSIAFSAVVLPQGAPQDVTWSVIGGGTISGNGVYTAPSSPPGGPVRIRAASRAVPSVAGEATVTFTAVTVVVSPSGTTIDPNQQQQFTAQVFPLTANQAVTWLVVSGGGSITPSGLYTAPSTGGITAVIRATSVAVPSAFGTATITIDSGPQSRTKQ